MINRLLKFFKGLMPDEEERKKDFYARMKKAKTSVYIDNEGRQILFVEDAKTPSEKMQDEFDPIGDDPDYRAADHIDEIKEIERKNGK